MLKNYKIWRGVAAALCLLFCVSTYLTSLAIWRQGDVNTFLGITAPRQAVTNEDTNYYPSDYPYGAGQKYATQAAARSAIAEDARKYNIQAQEEGTVLVKNANNALPLAATSRLVLLGNATASPVQRSGGGGAAGTNINYRPALEAAFGAANVYNPMGTTASPATTSGGQVNERPVSYYTTAIQNNFASTNANNIAVIMFSRYGGEMFDLNPSHADGPQLALHQNEKDILALAKTHKDNGTFSKIIVLINSGWAMDLGWLSDAQYGVDACLIVGLPGGNWTGVANVLIGTADPSGSLNNAWPTSSLSAPAMRNFGNFTFSGLTTQMKNKYVVYAEGVYVGYKYYETRYQDQVLNINNAKGTKGSYSPTGPVNRPWDYALEMAFPFGHGISYANFTQELVSLDWNRTTHKVTASVKVTNNGAPAGSSYTGKSNTAVQLYVQLPWQAGQSEKSAIQLIDFGKTKNLAKGENQTVTIETDDYIFASYDQNATNGAQSSRKGCYVFDRGDYHFAIGNDSHDALNNVLKARNVSGLFSHTGASVTGDATKVKTVNLASLDNTTHARSMWGDKEIVSNQYTGSGAINNEYIDLNEFIPGKVTYLTRGDWNTYPDPVTNVEATDLIREQMEGKWYKRPAHVPPVNAFKSGVKNDMNFATMREVDFNDDANWEAFLDQLTVKELATIPGETMANAAIQSVQFPATSNGDGPSGMASGYQHVSQTVLACTFNKDLLKQRGYFIAEDMHVGFNGTIYAPGANWLRTQYGGRNGEYWSEDSSLSFICNAQTIREMTNKGAIASTKHFAGNDQELNRHGHALFATEQGLRQGSLKAFEGGFTYGGAMGTMTSFSRIGCVAATSSRATMTAVLRNEWGFKGVNMTDSSKDSASYVYTAEALLAGTNQFNNDPLRTNEILQDIIARDNNGEIYQKLRETAKYFFYTYSRSHIANGMSADSIIIPFVPWWQPVIIWITVGIGVLMVAALFLFVFSGYFYKRNKKQEVSA